MEKTDAIPTDEMKEKLSHLEEYIPGEPQFTYDFANYLATRLNPELNPMGFIMAMELTLYDCQAGKNGFNGEPTPHSITGMPSQVYAVMGLNTPRFAEAVCPDEFADKVKEAYDEIHK